MLHVNFEPILHVNSEPILHYWELGFLPKRNVGSKVTFELGFQPGVGEGEESIEGQRRYCRLLQQRLVAVKLLHCIPSHLGSGLRFEV